MKRWTSLLLIFAFLLAASGCRRKAAPPKTPVTFYYPAVKTVYDGKTAVIHPEIRDGTGYEADIEGLLALYLQGPASETLRSPFPSQLTLIRYSTTSNTASVVLSSEFAQLTGIDLTLACTCIANTLFDLTQLERLQIFATNSQLDGQTSITLARDDIYYLDNIAPTEEPADTPGNE